MQEERSRVTYGDEVDTGGYFVKSPWAQEGSKSLVKHPWDGSKSYDQTEKTVDKYLQAVLQKY